MEVLRLINEKRNVVIEFLDNTHALCIAAEEGYIRVCYFNFIYFLGKCPNNP